MKKVIGLILAITLILSVVGCSSPTETTKQTTTTAPAETTAGGKTTEASPEETTAAATEAEAEPEGPIKFETETGILTYVDHEMTKDYEGNPAMIVYFDYTNKDPEEARNAMFEYSVVGFQNGIEGDISIIMDGPDELENTMTDIKEGVTLPVAFSFGLQDETSEIELEVSELISFSNDKQVQILEIK